MRRLLKRIKAVNKAAFSQPKDRPTIQQHIDSMRVESDLLSPSTTKSIVVVDDFVTRGTSFVATIGMLREAFPRSSISAFAMVRTMSGEGVEVERIIEP